MKVDATDSRVTAIAAAQTQLKPFNEQQTKQTAKENSSTVEHPSIKSNDKVTIQLDISKSTLETLQKVGNVGDILLTTAQNIRKTDESLSAGSEIVAKMRDKLGQIVKQYPPFPPDDRSRMELLMSYSGLQKQITSLMVPPPPAPVYDKVKHLWENLFTNQSNTIPTPQLPNDAPDSHIKLAVSQLENTQNQVSLVQESLGNSFKGA